MSTLLILSILLNSYLFYFYFTTAINDRTLHSLFMGLIIDYKRELNYCYDHHGNMSKLTLRDFPINDPNSFNFPYNEDCMDCLRDYYTCNFFYWWSNCSLECKCKLIYGDEYRKEE